MIFPIFTHCGFMTATMAIDLPLLGFLHLTLTLGTLAIDYLTDL